MQAASPAAPKRRLRQRARLLVQGIDAAPAAAQTETGFDAGRVAPRVQADHQSAVIVDATASVNNSGCDRTRITSASPQLSDIAGLCWYFAFGRVGPGNFTP